MPDKRIPAQLRRLVEDRASQCCEYCRTQARYSADAFTVDHIAPRSLGGLTTIENLAFCCQGWSICVACFMRSVNIPQEAKGQRKFKGSLVAR